MQEWYGSEMFLYFKGLPIFCWNSNGSHGYGSIVVMNPILYHVTLQSNLLAFFS